MPAKAAAMASASLAPSSPHGFPPWFQRRHTCIVEGIEDPAGAADVDRSRANLKVLEHKVPRLDLEGNRVGGSSGCGCAVLDTGLPFTVSSTRGRFPRRIGSDSLTSRVWEQEPRSRLGFAAVSADEMKAVTGRVTPEPSAASGGADCASARNSMFSVPSSAAAATAPVLLGRVPGSRRLTCSATEDLKTLLRTAGPQREELLFSDAFRDAFYMFCGQDRRRGLDSKNFIQLCRDCGFMDGRPVWARRKSDEAWQVSGPVECRAAEPEQRLSVAEAEIVFAQAKPTGCRRMELHHFEVGLSLVAQRIGVAADVVRSAVAESGGPPAGAITRSRPASAARSRPASAARSRPASAAQKTPPTAWDGGNFSSRGCTPEPNLGRLPELPERPWIAGALHRNPGRSYQDVFAAFCGKGNPGLDGFGLARLCKASQVIDDSRMRTSDVDLIFARIAPRGHRRISLLEFEEALWLLAEKLNIAYGDVLEAVALADLTHVAGVEGKTETVGCSRHGAASPH